MFNQRMSDIGNHKIPLIQAITWLALESPYSENMGPKHTETLVKEFNLICDECKALDLPMPHSVKRLFTTPLYWHF